MKTFIATVVYHRNWLNGVQFYRIEASTKKVAEKRAWEIARKDWSTFCVKFVHDPNNGLDVFVELLTRGKRYWLTQAYLTAKQDNALIPAREAISYVTNLVKDEYVDNLINGE